MFDASSLQGDTGVLQHAADVMQQEYAAQTAADMVAVLSLQGWVAIGTCENLVSVTIAEVAADWARRLLNWRVDIYVLGAARSVTAAVQRLEEAEKAHAMCYGPTPRLPTAEWPQGFQLRMPGPKW